jgi:hypothetical protein
MRSINHSFEYDSHNDSSLQRQKGKHEFDTQRFDELLRPSLEKTKYPFGLPFEGITKIRFNFAIPTDQQAIGSLKDSKGRRLCSFYFPEILAMDGEQQTPSNETNIRSNETNILFNKTNFPFNKTNFPFNKTNAPLPMHLSSPAPPADGRHHDAGFCDFAGSFSRQPVSNLVIGSAQDLKIAADQGDAELNTIMDFVCIKAKVLKLIFKKQHII